MANHCPRCAGDLTLHSRYATVVCLRCRRCGELWTQVISRSLADLLSLAA